jgi:hypothetical protein
MATVNHCIICEGLRPEVNGKATILGFIGILPNARLWVGSLNTPASFFTLVFTFSPEAAVVRIRPQILDPHGRSIIPVESYAMLQLLEEYPSNVVINLAGLEFVSTGRHTVQLYVDDRLSYSESVMIYEGQPPAAHEPRLIGTERIVPAD